MKRFGKTSGLLFLLGVPAVLGSLWLFSELCAATGYPLPSFRAAPSQPVAYPHDRHLALGMECAACHIGVETGTHAGIPPTRFCADCHLLTPPAAQTNAAAAATGSNAPSATAASAAAAQWAAPTPPEMADYLRRHEEIPWNQYQRAPRHVYFSHRRHVVIAKLECAVCHGDMTRRSQPVTQAVFPRHLPGMNRCVACHMKEKVSTDCVTCHH